MTSFLRAHPYCRAILFAVLSFTIWAFCDAINKFTLLAGAKAHHMMLFNALGGLTTIAVVRLIRKQRPTLKPKNSRQLAVYSVLFPANFLIMFVALRYLPLAMFFTIAFLTPICVALLSAVLGHEKPNAKKLCAILAGFVGAAIVINPFHIAVDWQMKWGVLAGLVSMFVFSIQSLMMRVLGKNEAADCIVFYPRMANLVMGALALIVLDLPTISPFYLLLPFCGGLVGCLGWYMLAEAYRIAPASTVAPFRFTQIITGSVLGYVLWQEVPGPHVYIGAAIIILAALYIVRHSRPQPMVEESTG